MGSSTNGKLVSNLAEALVNELSDSKTLNLMNDKKFGEFTDLLHEILDNQQKSNGNEDDNSTNLKVKGFEDQIKSYFNILDRKLLNLQHDDNILKVKTTRMENILNTLKKLQNDGGKDDGEEGGEGEDEKSFKDSVWDKKEKENKQLKMDLKTQRMLSKLVKSVELAEKKNKERHVWVKKGIKKVSRKIGSLMWKIFNKFKSWLIVGLLILFAKPLWNALKESLRPIWEETIKPKLDAWFGKIGEVIAEGFEVAKDWFKSTFPEIAEWIQNDWPKVKQWFADNWENTKKWFVETFPQIQKALNAILDSWIVRKFRKDSIEDEIDELKRQKAKVKKGSIEEKEIDLRIKELEYDYNLADKQFEDEKLYAVGQKYVGGTMSGAGMYQQIYKTGAQRREEAQAEITQMRGDIVAKREFAQRNAEMVQSQWENTPLTLENWQNRDAFTFGNIGEGSGAAQQSNDMGNANIAVENKNTNNFMYIFAQPVDASSH